MSEALNLLAGVERHSRLLSRILEPDPRIYRIDEGLAVAEGLRPVGPLPFPLPAIDRPSGFELSSPARADIVLLGRPDRRLRVRAFYLSAGLTVAVHGRMSWRMPNRLGRGAKVLARVHGRGDLVLPRVLETGRRLRHAWLVEDRLVGRTVRPDDWPTSVGRVIDGLWDIWTTGGGAQLQPVSRLLGPDEMSHALLALRSDDRTSPETIERAVELSRSLGKVTVGWCHGDPGRVNVLELDDGRLGLVDWEAAGHRAIAHDALKAVMWLDDPFEVARGLAQRVRALGEGHALGLREQLGLACLNRIASSQRRLVHVQRSDDMGFEKHAMRTFHRYLELLPRLVGG